MGHRELYVLRHGETEWNVEGRIQGHGDSRLTERGRAQAARQGQILAAQGALALPAFVSPAGRARQTAEIALGGRPFAVDERLMEIGCGVWETLLYAEIGSRWPPISDHWFFRYDEAPGGEGLQAVAARAAAFLADLPGPAVIVTHGVCSMLLRGAALGLDMAETADLPGGQGIVWHLRDGQMRRLE